MSIQVHSSAVVHPGAELGEDVIVGPFCVVDGSAVLGARTHLRSHVVVGLHTELGEDNVVFPFTTVGMEPQDLKYRGERTILVVGNRNQIREHCTLHRGTEGGGGSTVVGDDNLMQVGAHVAHDCLVGSGNVLAHHSSLAGHVTVGSHCVVGAYSAVHQFCRVGDHAFMGGFTVATMDVLPFMKTVGARDVKSYGPNSVGLKRRGFSEETIGALGKAHRILFHKDLPLAQALEQVEAELGSFPEVGQLVAFIRAAERGVHRG